MYLYFLQHQKGKKKKSLQLPCEKKGTGKSKQLIPYLRQVVQELPHNTIVFYVSCALPIPVEQF